MWACVNNKKSCVGPVHCTLPELCMSHQVIGHICLPLCMGLQGKGGQKCGSSTPSTHLQYLQFAFEMTEDLAW